MAISSDLGGHLLVWCMTLKCTVRPQIEIFDFRCRIWLSILAQQCSIFCPVFTWKQLKTSGNLCSMPVLQFTQGKMLCPYLLHGLRVLLNLPWYLNMLCCTEDSVFPRGEILCLIDGAGDHRSRLLGVIGHLLSWQVFDWRAINVFVISHLIWE